MEIVALSVLVMLVLVAIMVFLTPRRRMICFALGLVVAWDAAMLGRFESFLLFLLAPPGLAISLAALLVEAPAFVIRTVRRHSR